MPDSGSQNSTRRLVDFLKLGQEYLEKKKIEEARLKVERLLCHLLGKDRISLYLDFDRPLTHKEIDSFRELLKRATAGEPIQYITGEAGFYNSEFIVQPGVLIPRPETELIIDLCKKSLPGNGYNNGLDVGCGSGILAITALEEGISAKMTAIDVSETAIYVTYLNAIKHGYSFDGETKPPETQADFNDLIKTRSNTIRLVREESERTMTLVICLMDAFKNGANPTGFPFDLVLSNPPYITKSEYDELPFHILNFEPELALRSGTDGLDAHRFLASSLKNWLDTGGDYFGEFGAWQKESIVGIYADSFRNQRIIHDLNNLPRVIHCKKL